MSCFFELYENLCTLNEVKHKQNSQNTQKTKDAMEARIEELQVKGKLFPLKALQGITDSATNQFWEIYISDRCKKNIEDFSKKDLAYTSNVLNKYVSTFKLTGTCAKDTGPIKDCRYPILEFKLGTGPTGQPIRILYFMMHSDSGRRFLIFAAAFVHRDTKLTMPEKEAANAIYQQFL